MRKRLPFYLLNALIVIALVFLSNLLYWRNLERAASFFLERIENITLIFALILMLANLTDVVAYRGFYNREYDLAREVSSILGKLLIIILIVSFAEFFIFYRTKIGRIIYLYVYLLLSLCFVGESIALNILTAGKKQKILWLSSIPFPQVDERYLKNVSSTGAAEVSTKPGRGDYDVVVYDYPPKNRRSLEKILEIIITTKNPIDLITYVEELTESVPLRYVDRLWLLKNIRTFENAYDKLRRVMNFVGSFVLILLLFPPAFLFSLAHRLESKGPLFYIQSRAGYLGREFRLIKFRTMVNDAEKDGPRFSSEDDPRITKVGKIMRKFRIDEIPQLLNVLKGDMNLIGPRPERGDFIDILERKIPYYRLRLKVRPGLTGWAQVNFPYAGAKIGDHMKKLEFDLYYIKNRGFALDTVIFFKTLKTMVSKRGT